MIDIGDLIYCDDYYCPEKFHYIKNLRITNPYNKLSNKFELIYEITVIEKDGYSGTLFTKNPIIYTDIFKET